MTKYDKVVLTIKKEQNKTIKIIVKQIKKYQALLYLISRSGMCMQSSYNELVKENVAYKIESIFLFLEHMMGYCSDETDELSHFNYYSDDYIKNKLKEMLCYWKRNYKKNIRDIKSGRW